MKVLMLNGSPHENGTTKRALLEVANALKENGVESEILTVGNKRVAGCMACGACSKAGKCVYDDDLISDIVKKIEEADGLVIGSPVYYASINGTLKSILDRVFYSKNSFANKVGASVVVARRAGTTATYDIINKYFAISSMPIVTSNYWNNVHGSNGSQAELDLEGMQTMRILGQNMAWLIKCIKLGKESGITPPTPESKIKTNFIK